jgi:iron complex transport system substrate-binding protein
VYALSAYALTVGVLILLAGASCDQSGNPTSATKPAPRAENRRDVPPAPQKKSPTLASLSPAATDLLVGMGAGDHLVAVSNFDADRTETRGLARVGDYRTQDWEKLSALRPKKMIIQMRPDRLPPGLGDRAQELGIELVNLTIDGLDDVFKAIPQLGQAAGEQDKAAARLDQLRRQFETVRRRVENAPKVKTLIVVNDDGRSVAGPGTFLDDILRAAGGENAAAPLGIQWPTVDREKILELQPQVVIHLLPEASPQVVREAQKLWADLPQLPAVRDKRVHVLTEWYALLPGDHVGAMAEQYALILHPFANVKALSGEGQTDSRQPPARLLQQAQEARAAHEPRPKPQ